MKVIRMIKHILKPKKLILLTLCIFLLSSTLTKAAYAMSSFDRIKSVTWYFFSKLMQVPEVKGTTTKNKIHINTGTINPTAENSAGSSTGKPDYYIVQFTGPINESWKKKVANAGGKIYDYIPDFSFIVRMDATSYTSVKKLSEVAWVGYYKPEYKLRSGLDKQTGTLDLVVQTFPDTTVADIRKQIEKTGAQVSEASDSKAGGQMRLKIDSVKLKTLSELTDVRWIEPFYERKLTNEVARSDAIMATESAWNNLGLYGQGQVIGVADTGLDTGNLTTLHPDFFGSPTGCTGTSRVIATFALGRPGDWSDSYGSPPRPHGHGTHVVGSVLGNGCRSGSNGTPNYSGSYAGMAPQAGIVFQSILDINGALGGIPGDLNTLLAQARTAGARIHTNSWGAAVAGQYTTDARNTDLFIWNNKDMTILFAAGNSGVDTNKDGIVDNDSVYTPGTSKNAITVGATENLRLSYCPGSTWGSAYGEPIAGDCVVNNAAGMAAFSSRGPSDDGRIKPDIVAPGVVIQSVRAYQATSIGGDPINPYRSMSGTSMATPLTAGAVAIIRQFYTDVKGVTPSGALLKATLINSATDLYPGQYANATEQNPHLPNFAQGWGRVNVANAVNVNRSFQDVTDANGLSTGDSQSFTYQVSSPSLKISLVWTDYPGATSATRELVNDLDLVVTSPNGVDYLGNVFSNGWSTSGGTTDRVNNVENVYIKTPTPGIWTVTVRGYNVPNGNNGKQGYALVVDIPGGTLVLPSPSPTPAPKSGDANGDGLVNETDYGIWLLDYNKGISGGASTGDFNLDGTVDGADYVLWLNNSGK